MMSQNQCMFNSGSVNCRHIGGDIAPYPNDKENTIIVDYHKSPEKKLRSDDECHTTKCPKSDRWVIYLLAGIIFILVLLLFGISFSRRIRTSDKGVQYKDDSLRTSDKGVQYKDDSLPSILRTPSPKKPTYHHEIFWQSPAIESPGPDNEATRHAEYTAQEMIDNIPKPDDIGDNMLEVIPYPQIEEETEMVTQ